MSGFWKKGGTFYGYFGDLGGILNFKREKVKKLTKKYSKFKREKVKKIDTQNP